MSGVRIPAPLLFLAFPDMKNYLKNQFGEFVIKEELFSPNDKVLVAVSGGRDSMVLLDLLCRWRRRLKISLGVVHLNHQLRPQSAEKDQLLVQKICSDLKLPLYILKENVKQFAKENKLSLEEAGHILREKRFQEIAHQHGYHKIATAHHQDDQAETVLMRILAGTGLQGIAGIRLRKGKWVRPLLGTNRKEIAGYAQSRNLSYREDESNKDISFRRNKVRQLLLPMLASEFNSEVNQHLTQLSNILQEWDVYISGQVKELFPKYVKRVSQNEITVGITFFRLYFSWIELAIIESVLYQLQSAEYRVQFRQYQDFKHWIETGRIGSEFWWGGELQSIKRKDRIDFRIVGEQEPAAVIDVYPAESYLLPVANIKMSITEITIKEMEFSNNPDIEFIAGEGLKFPLMVRFWKSGDYFRPLGSKTKKKVSDFLTDIKVGFPQKKQIYVLINQDDIVAVLGYRISDDYRIKDESTKIFRLTMEKVSQ